MGAHGTRSTDRLRQFRNGHPTSDRAPGRARFFYRPHRRRFNSSSAMGRIVKPIRTMGAAIAGRKGGELAPLAMSGSRLHGITYASPVASAQIKSALLLAALYAEGVTQLTEPWLSRDHTERMFRYLGIPFKTGRDDHRDRRTPIRRLDQSGSSVFPGIFLRRLFFWLARHFSPARM